MIVAALALAAAPATAQLADTPRGFIVLVYSQYDRRGSSPLQRPARWFTPELTAAIREDSRLAGGEVGYLDGDPLCDCQDYRRISAKVTGYQRLTPWQASVRVHVDLGLRQTRDLKLSLLRTRAGWRVADVSTKEEPSLLQALRRSNANH